jgi:hypothetical protein
VICTQCGTTHALIPSFSLPGTSIGTAEALNYLYLRENGVARKHTADIFSNLEMKGNYATKFEKMFKRCVNNAKAIFTGIGDHNLNGIEWIKSVIKKDMDLINDFNRFCLEHNVNAILCNRANILVFKKNKKKKKVPLKKGSGKKGKKVIDSG